MSNKIKSLDELKKLKERVTSNTDIRTTGDNPDRTVIAVGMATCGIAAGAREVMNSLMEELQIKKVENVSVVATGCMGFCYAEPLIEIRPPHGGEPIRYANVDATLAKQIIDDHICLGKFVDSAIFNGGGNRS